MTDNVVPLFPDEDGDGGGPEDPMLEARVGRLETDLAEIKSTLKDLRADVRVQEKDLTEIKFTLAKLDAKLDGKLGAIEGRLSGIEGRIGSVEGRFNQVPTIWNMFALIVTLLIGMAGLMFTAGKFLHP